MGEPEGEAWEACRPVEPVIADLKGSSICVRETIINGININLGYISVPVLTDHVLKALAALRILYGLDVLVVRSGKTEISPSQASMLGIKLLTGETKIREAPIKSIVIRPQIDANTARKIFEEKVRGQIAGFVGSLSGRKATFIGMELAYLPIRCYRVLYNKRFSGSEELAIQDMDYCFELATGSLVLLDGEELSVDYSFSQLGELDETVVAAYELIGEKGEVSLDEISEILGSVERAEIVLRMLLDYGLLELVGMNTYVPQGPSERSGLLDYFFRKGLAVEGRPPRCSRVLGPGIETSIIDRIVSVWGVVKEKVDVYFPVYIGVFKKKKKGDEGLEIATIIDAVWGRRLEDIEELVASSKVIYVIDEIINEIINKIEKKCDNRSLTLSANTKGKAN